MEYHYILIFIALCIQLSQSSTAEEQIYRHPHESDPSIYGDDLEMVKLSFDKQKLNDDALTFYLRLVKQIFQKHRFKPDPQSKEEYFVGNVPLRLTKLQHELLVNADIAASLNLNEIDGLVEEIFMKSKDDQYSPAEILFEYYRQELIASITSFSSPLLWVITALCAILIINKIFHLSRLTFSAMIVISVLAICAISYAMMYYDCLNDLEVEQMISLSREQSTSNPCKNYQRENESFWGSLKATVMGSAESECHKHMRKMYTPSKKYCDPLDVFAKWSAKIQMSYFGSIFGELLELLTSMTSSSSIFTKIITWTASIIFFAFIFITLLKMIVTHSFQGFFGMLSGTPSSSTGGNPERKSSFELLNSKMDALLLENEHMKRELSVIRECSVERSISSPPPPSLPASSKLESIEEK